MSEKKTFLTSGLSDIRWLRVRGLMNEKNVEGKIPLQLFDNFPPETISWTCWTPCKIKGKFIISNFPIYC